MSNLNIKIFLLLLFLVGGIIIIGKVLTKREQTLSWPVLVKTPWWQVQSIDTMKYSRDIAREKLNDPSFDAVIDEQVKNISKTGATHLAIGTPYDAEFIPFLKRWINVVRKYKLNVWFRGNFSGWEGWFDYPKLSREEHLEKTEQFILNNKDLFVDGDIFSSCPEAENGGPGDPRLNGDVSGHQKFLIKEYELTKKAFNKIDKNVKSNYFSMNGDVARLIMDQKTTNSLDGLVVIDHYVATPDKLVSDINALIAQTKGQIVLGEMGVPIPDIHGQMTEEQQALWLNEALSKLIKIPHLVGLNYWTNTGSSTQLWDKDNQSRQAAAVLKQYFKPQTITGIILNQVNKPIYSASVITDNKNTLTDKNGNFTLAYLKNSQNLVISAKGYKTLNLKITQVENMHTISLQKEQEDLWFKLKKDFFKLFYN